MSKINTKEQTNADYELSLDSCFDYLRYKIPLITLGGGLYGASLGYYIGGLTALYGYGYGLGCGIAGSSFYAGTYGLRYLRKKDDYVNYAISGGINAAWIMTGLHSHRRGLIALFGGSVLGALYQIVGDYTYTGLRNTWLRHRIHGIYQSGQRELSIRKPAFPPRDKESFEKMEERARLRRAASASIIPVQFLKRKDQD